VHSILAFDSLKKVVYYLATAPGEPNQRNLYSVPLNASRKPTCISCELLTPEGEFPWNHEQNREWRWKSRERRPGHKREEGFCRHFSSIQRDAGAHARCAHLLTWRKGSARIFHPKLCKRHAESNLLTLNTRSFVLTELASALERGNEGIP